MKRFSVYVLTVALGGGLGCNLQPKASSANVTGIVAQFHFAGFDQLRGSTNATALAEILGLPETAELRDRSVTKLASALGGYFEPKSQSKTDSTASASRIRPLLTDLLRTESYGELTGRGKESPAWTFAIRTRADTRALWRTNISELVSNWQFKKEWANYQLAEFTTNSWLVLSILPKSPTGTAVETSLLGHIRSKGQPPEAERDHLLKLDADWSKLVQLCPKLPLSSLGELKLAVAGKGNNLRTEGKLTFTTARDWKLERWNVPTNTITDPQNSLISFTAIQGLAPWLGRQEFVQQMRLKPPPNQLYVWGQAYTPYQLQAAASVGDATNFISQFAKKVVPRVNTNLYEHAVGQIQFGTNHLVWLGLPILYPYLAPAADSGFVHAGILPVARDTNPPPSELIQQFTGRTNLLYYDWEITQARLGQLRELAYLMSLFVTVPNMETNAPTAKWLDAVEPKLGNTVTEISAISRKELSLVRTSPLGLNGIELLTLAYWLNSTNFPRSGFDIRFRPATPLPR